MENQIDNDMEHDMENVINMWFMGSRVLQFSNNWGSLFGVPTLKLRVLWVYSWVLLFVEPNNWGFKW